MCYHEKISRYWFGLWAKSCTIDRKTEYVAGAIFHTFGLFTPSRWEAAFPGLYIITHVLFIFLRSMVMWRGPHKMDATGRLTYRLLNTDTRTKVRHGGAFSTLINWPVCFRSRFRSATQMSHFIYSSVIISLKNGCFLLKEKKRKTLMGWKKRQRAAR